MYLDTSVIGYATSWPRNDPVVAARQQLTRDWFETIAPGFQLFVSRLVLDEATAGNAEAARERLALIYDIPQLEVTTAVNDLAAVFITNGAVPAKAVGDAEHIAVAAVHGVDFMLTWNCRHIANANKRHDIEQACRRAGYGPPVICTLEELPR